MSSGSLRGYQNLVLALLTGWRNDEGYEMLSFAESGWARYLCDSAGLDYGLYLEWAERKSKEMDALL